MEKHDLLSVCQHGFRQQRFTETAILNFVNSVYRRLEEELFVVGILLDLFKAFDSLDHMHKADPLGIRGMPLKLFQSYLKNRKQSVFFNKNYPPFKPILKGVPQGSVLGPLFFLIYIIDIVNASTEFTFVIYADDTTLLLKNKNINRR